VRTNQEPQHAEIFDIFHGILANKKKAQANFTAICGKCQGADSGTPKPQERPEAHTGRRDDQTERAKTTKGRLIL
jgi:hypothetical protein